MKSVAPKVGLPNEPRFVPESIFFQSRLKVFRARTHLAEVSGAWEYSVNVHRELAMGRLGGPASVPGWSLFNIQLNAGVPLAIGDCIRNLRSAMDYLTSALARNVILSDGDNMSDENMTFPFAKKRASIKANFDPPPPGKEKGFRVKAIYNLSLHYPDLAETILEKVQPYSKEDGARDTGDLLWRVITSDNVDKHRLITPFSQHSGVRSALFQGGGGMFNSTIDGNMGFPAQAFEQEPDIDYDLIFRDVDRLNERPVIGTLMQACDVASDTVELFEKVFFSR